MLQVELCHHNGFSVERLADTLFVVAVVSCALHVCDTTIAERTLIWLRPGPVLVVWVPGDSRVYSADTVANNVALDRSGDCYICDAPRSDSEVPVITPVAAPGVRGFDVLHRRFAIHRGRDPPAESIDSMVCSVMPIADAEHTARVAHELMIGFEGEGHRTLLVHGRLHDADFGRIAVNISDPVVTAGTCRCVGIISDRHAVASLAVRLAWWCCVLVLEVLDSLSADIIGEARSGNDTSLGHKLHWPMREATLAAIMAFPIIVRSARCHLQPGEDVLRCIPLAVRGNAHASIHGCKAAEGPAAAAMPLIVNLEDSVLALRPLELGTECCWEVLGVTTAVFPIQD